MLLVILGACSSDDDGVDPDDDGLSIFRVEYSHSGDLDAFVKSFTIGTGFVFTNTTEAAPVTLFDGDLLEMTYSFTTAMPVEMIELSSVVGFIPLQGNEPAEIRVVITVYRDDELVETTEIVTTDIELTETTNLSYQGV